MGVYPVLVQVQFAAFCLPREDLAIKLGKRSFLQFAAKQGGVLLGGTLFFLINELDLQKTTVFCQTVSEADCNETKARRDHTGSAEAQEVPKGPETGRREPAGRRRLETKSSSQHSVF